MTTPSICFNLKAVHGSEFDLYKPPYGGPSIIRPTSVPEGCWPGYSSDGSKLREFTEVLWRELKLPNDFGWTEIDFDSPKLSALVARLAELKTARLVEPRQGRIEIKLVDTPEDPCQWFELIPLNDDGGPWGKETTCKADKVRPGVHVTSNCVCEKFKAVVEENGFTGLDFLWLRDIGKYAAPQWFMITAQNPIGRGMDHEFFDSTKYKENPVIKPSGAPARIGVAHFNGDKLKSPTPFSSPLHNDLLSLFPPREVVFSTSRQFLRKHLPESDFAYAWNGLLFRSICFNRKVRDALVAARVVSLEECEPIKIWDECPPGAEVLDGISPIFPIGRWYYLSDEEYAKAKKDAESAWAYHLASPKPKRQATIKSALRLLKEAKATRPDSFSAKLKKAEFEAAMSDNKIHCPNQWLQVLQLANGFDFSLEDSFEALPLGHIEDYSSDTQERAECGDAKFPNNLLHITHGFCGDFHSLDLSTQNAQGDCRVFLFSHETLQPQREWESIADFVQEIAETMLAESPEG